MGVQLRLQIHIIGLVMDLSVFFLAKFKRMYVQLQQIQIKLLIKKTLFTDFNLLSTNFSTLQLFSFQG